MAFLDFLSQSPFGQTAQGPNLSGSAGIPAAGAPTWGQMLGTAMQYGSKPGSSGAAFGSLLSGQSAPADNAMLALGPQKKKQDSTSMITTLLGIFGL